METRVRPRIPDGVVIAGLLALFFVAGYAARILHERNPPSWPSVAMIAILVAGWIAVDIRRDRGRHAG
jgi:hypothetical protein